MRRYKITARLAVAVVMLFCMAPSHHALSQQLAPAKESGQMSRAEFEALMKSVSNWGRWGPEDQLGSINLITPAKRREAARVITAGESISLAHNVITEKVGTSQPFEQHMLHTGLTPGGPGATDSYSVAYHGHTQTHLDALCHMFYDGKLYNGFSQQEVTDRGAAKLSVIYMKNGIFTRGVLIDLPRLRGSAYLKGGQAIFPADLDEWEKKTGVQIRSGDAVFVRTGRWARVAAEPGWDLYAEAPGLHVSCAAWFKKRDIALLGSDHVSDVTPSLVEGMRMPLHITAINAMGLPLIDNCDLEALGEYAQAHHRLVFALTVAPLAVDGGTGSPANPIATF